MSNYESEAKLENRMIEQLRKQGYSYIEINDVKELEENFRSQVNLHNKVELKGKDLSDKEFEKLMIKISGKSIFQSAKELRQKHDIIRDDGTVAYIELFNTKEWCKNIFQVTHQTTVEGKYVNRYDVTILINGLPLIQIELKRRGIDMKEAFDQIKRYKNHSYNGLYRFIQLFVISNGVDTKYFANGDQELNYGFTFYWTDVNNDRITNLEQFCTFFLDRCHVAKMIARYMIINETEKMLMVMRPYQVYAVENIVDRAINTSNNGYVWHTTGSGKTITSFKTSQILSLEPSINQVFFLVDRKDLDKQTLDDLAIFGNNRTKSVYDIFNRTRTRGGAKILEEMFLYPLSDADQINERSDVIRYYRDIEAEFPFRGEIFDTMEFYLGNTDRRTQLMTQDNTLGRKFKNLVGTDTEYTQIHNGIVCCIELLNTLDAFLKNSKADADNKTIAELTANLRGLLGNEKWSWYVSEKGKKKLSYEQAVVYDRVLRFEERDKLMKILYYVYLLDVYMAVANVAKERGFVFAKAHPNDKNTLVMKGMFHPFLAKPVGNTITVDENSNVIFLTGANMAGKSTFMKSFGITVFLAHVGFPVPAKEMEFSVQNGMFTTINLPDNLSMGYSHFYAEVLRVKKVAQQVRQTQHLIVVFDELFRGTNVKDAYDATVAVTEAFAGIRNCTFIISTHIIEAGEVLKEKCDNINFVYLPTKMEGSKPVYTYTLAPGITDDRHGMMIVNNEHIIEIIKNGEA